MSKTTAKTIIRKAYRLLTNEDRWGKEAFAGTRKLANGTIDSDVVWADPSANCFCMLGAMRRVNGGTDGAYSDAVQAVSAATRQYLLDLKVATPTSDIAVFNDRKSTKHRDVLKVFRKAYALAGGSRP